MDGALPYFDEIVGDDEIARINYVTAMNSCLVMTDDHTRALWVIEDLAARHVTEPLSLAAVDYMLGIHHVRYANEKDVELAERHMLRALETVRAAHDLQQTRERPFLEAFIGNGLALIRVRQKRPVEAVELCRAGYEALTRGLDDDRHLLHRSVLLYNIAQVYVLLGLLEDGLDYYRHAIAMDPYYSEYHNETGNILQRLERYDEAVNAYVRAIDCGAPYPEVYFNKAVCHMRQAQADDALACFAETLELNPNQPEVFALRAELLAELGRPDEALAEYDGAILLGYQAIAARVNRAVLHFDRGANELALSDMDHVIAADPEEAAHYENRAVIHQAMNREDLRLRDLAEAERRRELVS